MRSLLLIILLVAGMSSAQRASAGVMLLDLNEFYQSPPSAITVSADGRQADLVEVPFGSVALEDIPAFGDPELIIPASGRSLLFEYEFIEQGVDPKDEFVAALWDDDGNFIGTNFQFVATETSSGTVQFDLSSLTSEANLGLSFRLNAVSGDESLDSTLKISDVRLVDAPIPEPSSVLAWSVLCGIAVTYRKRRKRHQAESV